MVEQGLGVAGERVVGVGLGLVWLGRETVAAVVEGDGAVVVVDEGVEDPGANPVDVGVGGREGSTRRFPNTGT